MHRDHDPTLGEIYVISVDPRHHGQGWGRSLTVAGLVSLAARGVPVGMLYAERRTRPPLGSTAPWASRSTTSTVLPARPGLSHALS